MELFAGEAGIESMQGGVGQASSVRAIWSAGEPSTASAMMRKSARVWVTEVHRQTLDLRLLGALRGYAHLKTRAGYAIVRSLTAHPFGPHV
jgi:hypothetical protein